MSDPAGSCPSCGSILSDISRLFWNLALPLADEQPRRAETRASAGPSWLLGERAVREAVARIAAEVEHAESALLAALPKDKKKVLVEALGEGMTMPQMAEAWAGRVPLRQGAAIMGWLYRQGLLTEVPSSGTS